MATPLFVRSSYSLLQSMCSIEDIVLSCQKFGYKSCAVVDKNVLAYAPNFKKACEKQDIKPIYGLEVDATFKGEKLNIALYARNDEGYKNLMKLSSFINGKEDTLVNIEELKKYKANNFTVIMSDSNFLSSAFDLEDSGDKRLSELKNELGEFLIGLADHNIAANYQRDKKIKFACLKAGIKTIAISRTFYINKEDAYEYEILRCIKDKETIKDNADLKVGRHFLSKEEFFSLYDEDDLKNSDILADLCEVSLNYKTNLPLYKCPNNVSSKEYLISLTNAGLNRRLNNKVSKEYRERLDYELSVVIKMHFEDYFLIVYDFILYAKKNNMYVGPGRGSAAGSLIAYCLGITDLDPIKYGLLFERFLNPERISMPDIDTDFPDDRRDEMFSYVKEKYGEDHVGHIVTYGTLKAKQVLRDVGRVLSFTPYEMDMLCKPIPSDPKITLDDAYRMSALFKQKVDSSSKNRKLFQIAKKLEGLPRHYSTHAAGVVFSRDSLSSIVPTLKIENDFSSTQYTMEHLEEYGLIKMDFLGLRNLSIIAEISEEIKIHVDKNFSIRNIPLNDAKTFDLIDRVNLLGVFQLESQGMQNLARKMKPRSFEELSMMIALFRPGPMENIPEFLDNRANPSKIKYLVKELEPILKETYGIIVYQEQIMAIARSLAGFTFGKADVLRRAMSKKKLSELEKLEADFIGGCIKNGYDKSIARELYNLILKFANYGFNKSHSIAYGLVAYQMAYLKANYPLYFYKALLNGSIGSESKTYDYIKECKKNNIKVLAPAINLSGSVYRVGKDFILMPFGTIKDLGSVSISKILSERNNGRFEDYVDCICRLTNAGVDRKALDNAISAGAFDEFKLTRFSMSSSLEAVLKYALTHKKEISFISGIDDRPIIKDLPDNKLVLAEKEKEVLGFYLSFNPIYEYKKEKHIECPSIAEIENMNGFVKGFGLIRRFKEHVTKNGGLMCFVDVQDDTGMISLAVMPQSYEKNKGIIEKDCYVVFSGKKDNGESILIKDIRKV